MRFIIDGVTCTANDVGNLTMADTLAMAKAGMGVHTWQRTLGQIRRLALDADDRVVVLSPTEAKERPQDCDPDLFMDSEPHLRAFLVMVWLARRGSGQPTLSFEASMAVKWGSLDFLPDEDDAAEPVEESPDPTPLPDSAVGDGSETPTSTESSPDSTT